jgi:GNAT superfamily N-acetyltransferase
MNDREKAYKTVTLHQVPDLNKKFWPQKQRIWPEFMFHDVAAEKLWGFLGSVFPEYQLYLLDSEDQPFAVGQTIPCVWDGTMEGLPVGWSDSLVRGVADYEAQREPNTLVALEIAIQPEYHGQGISYQVVQAIRVLAEQKGYQAIIVAVRPSLKSRYPLTPMERYVRWRQPDGAPFDSWLRVHWRSGGEILKVADPSMVVEASIADWEAWTGMVFPESGLYVVPDTLTPISIDREMGIGRYIEPNVWVHHPIKTKWLHRK